MPSPCYFLVAVSNRGNLDLCIKHGLAGFPNSANGAWTFEEIREGDFVSLLYGARAHNLYKVIAREAIRNAETLPPWGTTTSKIRSYYFPFRLLLEPVRYFTEPLVRAEFAYVAENLLMRGGYRKTHFQADQTTLQNASQMGDFAKSELQRLPMPTYEVFTPVYTRNRKQIRIPEVLPFQETILQTAIRQHFLNKERLERFLGTLNLQKVSSDGLEVLGEKALAQGHVDILLKERVPIGSAQKVAIEVKLGRAGPRDVTQVQCYVDELGAECIGGALVAADFGARTVPQAASAGVNLVRYSLEIDWAQPVTFKNLCENLRLQPA